MISMSFSKRPAWNLEKGIEERYSTEVKDGLPVGIFWTFPSILDADQQAANAVYDFLIDLMRIQRAVGKFGLFLSAEDREAWLKKMEVFFKRRRRSGNTLILE